MYFCVHGFAIGSSISTDFMVQLEEDVAPRLESIMPMWKRYVDDTFTFVKKNRISEVINEINSFHPNITFTHEKENNNSISFLDVLLTKQEDGTIETSVYRKPTNNSIYINWNAFGPQQWKTGTLSGIVRRAYEICSTPESRKLELEFIYDVFTRINSYPHYVVRSILQKAKEKQEVEMSNDTPNEPMDDQEKDDKKLIQEGLVRGEKGEAIIKRHHKHPKQNK